MTTRLEQAGAALPAAEERFRNIIDRSADGFLILDNRGVIRFANPAAQALFGRRAEDLVGEYFGYPCIAGEISELTVVSRKGRGATIEMRVVETQWEGEHALLANLRDVTEQKDGVEALRKSEARYSALIRASSQVLYSMSPDWGEMRQLQGGGFIADTEDPIRDWMDKYIHPEDRKRVRAVIDEAIRSGKVFELEHRVLRADGTPGWLVSRAVPVRDADGEVVEWFGAASDITERKRAEDEVKRLNVQLAARAEELEAANGELEAFNYTVAHDLRNPLNIINGHCQAIRLICGKNLDDQCSEYLEQAYQGTLRMNRLIDALLNFSRMARVELRVERVDLSSIAEAAADELRRSEKERKVTFRLAQGITVDGDAALLRVVMDNLLGNAWKYTAGREEGLVEFGETEVKGNVAFFVRDNGRGFDMSDASRLFSPFQRLAGADGYRGFGIGLATVERIVRRHGGRVWAEGEPGKGATFYFSLPHAGNRIS